MADGRNEAGQFAQGNTFSDGRNKHVHAAELRRLFCEAVTPVVIQQLAYKLTDMALDGDIQAAKLLVSTALKDVPAVVQQSGSVDNGKDRTLMIAERVKASRAMGSDAVQVQQEAALHNTTNPKTQAILERIRGQRAAAEAG